MTRAVLLAFGLLVSGCGAGISSPTPVEFIPPVQCIGIPAQTCQQIVTDARANAGPGVVPVTIRAVCNRASCTVQEGDVSVEIQYSDGRRDTYGMGWSGPMGGDPVPPVPTELPVEPTCQGIPAEPCRERAFEAVTANDDLGDITAIDVRCTTICTPIEGEGETRLTYADGTTSLSSWGYASGG